MSFREKQLAFLDTLVDTPLARPVAAWLLSHWASALLHRRVRIFHDAVWLRRDGDATIALGPRLHLRRHEILQWQPHVAEKINLAASWWYLCYQPAPGDVIVDIGAGMGEDALLFSRAVGPRGVVFSFEAHPLTARCLEQTIRYSQLANVTPVQGAVFSRQDTIEIDDLPPDRWQTNSVLAARDAGPRSTLAIPALALDDFAPLRQYPQIHFVKMNIEGAEIEALRGMVRTLAKVQCICVACHDFLADTNPRLITKATCRQLLVEAGFTVHEADPASPPWQRDQIHGVRER